MQLLMQLSKKKLLLHQHIGFSLNFIIYLRKNSYATFKKTI